jgi:hypothetical protein
MAFIGFVKLLKEIMTEKVKVQKTVEEEKNFLINLGNYDKLEVTNFPPNITMVGRCFYCYRRVRLDDTLLLLEEHLREFTLIVCEGGGTPPII